MSVDGDCSPEIKRHLFLGRKVMTNLDIILKGRDITLPKKVGLVKVMVFPVVMYGRENWTIKKAEKSTQTDGEIYRVHGLEESILSKWLYYPKQSIDSMQSLSSYQRYFSQN